MQICLGYVARKEKFDLPDEASLEIVEDSNGNLRKAILVMEALKMQSCERFLLLPSGMLMF